MNTRIKIIKIERERGNHQRNRENKRESGKEGKRENKSMEVKLFMTINYPFFLSEVNHYHFIIES